MIFDGLNMLKPTYFPDRSGFFPGLPGPQIVRSGPRSLSPRCGNVPTIPLVEQLDLMMHIIWESTYESLYIKYVYACIYIYIHIYNS
jgi:hypothetical protein